MALPDLLRVDADARANPVVRGGWTAAAAALQQVDPVTYARTRNHVDGQVTRLSPYLRHGVLTLAEVRDHALAVAGQGAEKLVNELSWRDYFQRVYAALGWRIWLDLDSGERGSEDLPADIESGTTGLACVDAWARELATTGYLHNHVRMWLAAYVVHHRRLPWQAGARWFARHLLDGDPASNNLSWQWVAGTSRSRRYVWNRANLRRYAGDRWCAECPLARRGCPFEASYEELDERFGPVLVQGGGPRSVLRRVEPERTGTTDPVVGGTVVWVHGDRLSPENEALRAHPDAPAVFVADADVLERGSDLRRGFLAECLDELPVQVRQGTGASGVAEEVRAFAAEHAAGTVVTTASVSPRFARLCRELRTAGLTVQVLAPPAFVSPRGLLDLRSHTAYWKVVRDQAMRPTPGTAILDR